PAPAGGAPSPARPRPTPDGGQGAGGLTEAAGRLRQLIDDGVRTGDIRDDVGLDLRNVLGNLTREVADGDSDLATPVALLREKVVRRVDEGGIDPGYARTLDAAIVQLGATQA
ncbi:serine/threonine protein kinase, partial [Micromonospora sp. CPCC 205711]